MRTDDLRLIGIPGTNKVMAGELSRLARRAGVPRLAEPRKEGLGGLVYPFDLATAALAVRYHRTASRVLWTLYQSRATRLEPLYAELLAAVAEDARPWLRDGATFSVSPAHTAEFAAGGRQLVGVTKNALVEGAARRGVRVTVDPSDPDLYLVVRVHDGLVTVSLDLAGRPMNQRGYRGEGGAAPLRENLAAVLVMLTRHDARREVLVDPLAGSGTIATEAACMGQGRSVWGAPRAPAAGRLSPFSAVLAEPAEPLFGDTLPWVVANERDPRIQAVCRANAATAGVGDRIETHCGDFRQLDPQDLRAAARRAGLDPQRGVILSNPPYGERLDPADLLATYRDLGAWCRQLPGWRAGFLVANPAFERAFGGRPRIKKPLKNGPLLGYFYLYDL